MAERLGYFPALEDPEHFSYRNTQALVAAILQATQQWSSPVQEIRLPLALELKKRNDSVPAPQKLELLFRSMYSPQLPDGSDLVSVFVYCPETRLEIAQREWYWVNTVQRVFSSVKVAHYNGNGLATGLVLASQYVLQAFVERFAPGDITEVLIDDAASTKGRVQRLFWTSQLAHELGYQAELVTIHDFEKRVFTRVHKKI